MGELELSLELRALARHQCVRDHGTPRVTTLVGDLETARALWGDWVRLTGRTRADAAVFEQPRRPSADWLPVAAARAFAHASGAPQQPVAVLATPDVLRGWATTRGDRLRSFIDEGVIEVSSAEPTPPASRSRPRAVVQARARSLAEVTMFEALEATPATAGRFQLNQPVSFQFGARAAEVDLLSRADDLAIEVDGYHHFTDLDHYRRDRRKDLLLQAHGYTVLRFLADDILREAEAAVRMVVEVLGVRRGRQRREERNR